MFDIGGSELLLIVIVAIVVIGPKDLPLAMRTAGRWIAKIRRVSGHFRAGIETMIREAELEEMERTWREQNAAIMAANPNPAAGQGGEPLMEPNPVEHMVSDQTVLPSDGAHRLESAQTSADSPQLPLPPP